MPRDQSPQKVKRIIIIKYVRDLVNEIIFMFHSLIIAILIRKL